MCSHQICIDKIVTLSPVEMKKAAIERILYASKIYLSEALMERQDLSVAQAAISVRKHGITFAWYIQ